MKMRLFILSAISGALLLLGLYPLGWPWYAWLAWLPLFLLIEMGSAKAAWRLAFIFGAFLIYYGIGNYWLLYYQWPLFLAIAFIAAAVMALYFGLYHILTRRSTSVSFKILCAFALWPLTQYLIRLTPITTALFEAPFYGPLEFFQIAAVVDYSFWGALVIGLSSAVALLIRERSRMAIFWITAFLIFSLGLYAWGCHRLSPRHEGKSQVALIQHNIPVSAEWRLDHPDGIRKYYRNLGLKAAAKEPALIIFPLYDFPDDPLRQPGFFGALAKETGSHVLVASHIPEVPGGSIFEHGYRNVAVLFAPDGKILDHYQSIEKAPSFSPVKERNAQKYKVLNSPLGKLGVLLCYEDTKPKFAKMAKQQGARILVALSNPGFFSKTHMPYYHLIQDRLRAIETGLPLLRVSSNGYSAHVDPRGRFIQKSELDREEILWVKI